MDSPKEYFVQVRVTFNSLAPLKTCEYIEKLVSTAFRLNLVDVTELQLTRPLDLQTLRPVPKE